MRVLCTQSLAPRILQVLANSRLHVHLVQMRFGKFLRRQVHLTNAYKINSAISFAQNLFPQLDEATVSSRLHAQRQHAAALVSLHAPHGQRRAGSEQRRQSAWRSPW